MKVQNKWKKLWLFVWLLAVSLGLAGGPGPGRAEAAPEIPVVKIRACEGVSYNMVGILVDNEEKSYNYQIYRSTSKNGKYSLIDELQYYGNTWYGNGSDVSYTYGKKQKIVWLKSDKQSVFVDSNVKFGKTYYYKIRLVSDSGEGEFSEIKSAKGVLESPTILKGYAASAKKVKLGWQKVEGAQGYQVYRKEGKKWKLVGKVGKKTTSFTDKKAKANKKYTYRVRAYRKVSGKAVNGQYSSTYQVKTKNPTVKGNYKAGSVYGPSLSTSKLQEVRRVVQSFKDNHIKSGMSDYQKVRTAYDYIRSNCKYAWRGWQYNGANTAWGALVYGEAQCSGYARGMKALCDAIGVKCYYVHANSSSANPSHQWNEVKVGGKWYILDAQGGFFLLSGNDYQSMTGMKWNKSGLPKCSKTSYKYATLDPSEV